MFIAKNIQWPYNLKKKYIDKYQHLIEMSVNVLIIRKVQHPQKAATAAEAGTRRGGG